SDVATTETDKIKKSDLPNPKDVIIVGDYREIEVNKNLVAKSDKAYQKEAIVTDMERIKQEISTIIDENIPFQEELIAALTKEKIKKEKRTKKNEMKNETKKEQTKTEKEIEHKDNAISSAEEEIEANKLKVKELKEKYENREEKLAALLHSERQLVEENQEPKEQKQQQEAKKKHEKHQKQEAEKQEKKEKEQSKKKQKKQQKKEIKDGSSRKKGK